MLISDTTDILKYIPVTASNDFSVIKPFIKQAEREFIIPLISKELYEELLDQFNINGITDEESDEYKLLELIQETTAHFAYYLYIPSAQISIQDSGLKVLAGEGEKTPEFWQIKDLRREYLKMGYRAADHMLAFLEENKASFPAWTASTNYQKQFELFINSATEFSEYVNINESRRTFLVMRSVIKKVEDFYIKPVIGAELFASLKAAILAGTTADLSDTDKTTLSLVKHALAYLSFAQSIIDLTVIIDDMGISIYNISAAGNLFYSSPADKDRLSYLRNENEKTGKNYLQQLEDHLSTEEESTSEDEGNTLGLY